jgi:hypothetical protein
MTNSYITPSFLIKGSSSSFKDYRSVVNGSGTTVIFERSSPKDSEDDCTLYSLDLKTGAVTQFLTGTSAPL